MRVYLTERSSPVSRQKLEVRVYRKTTVHLRVIVRAVVLLALPMLLTRIDFVVARVILLLLPAMAVGAPVLVLTPVGVASDEVFYFPILAKLFLIVIQLRLSP